MNHVLQDSMFKITTTSPKGQWVKDRYMYHHNASTEWPVTYAHLILLCVWAIWWIYMIHSPISFRVMLLAASQPWYYHHPSDDLTSEELKKKPSRASVAIILRILFSYTLSREYRVVRNRYSQLIFTSEDRLCANLRVQEQSTNMTSQCQCPAFAWRHR